MWINQLVYKNRFLKFEKSLYKQGARVDRVQDPISRKNISPSRCVIEMVKG